MNHSGLSAPNTIERMRQKLAALAPADLVIEDESAAHAGHAGAQAGGGHYRLRIITDQFAGMLPIARHRLVYDTLAELMLRDIHALSIEALTPDEAFA